MAQRHGSGYTPDHVPMDDISAAPRHGGGYLPDYGYADHEPDDHMYKQAHIYQQGWPASEKASDIHGPVKLQPIHEQRFVASTYDAEPETSLLKDTVAVRETAEDAAVRAEDFHDRKPTRLLGRHNRHHAGTRMQWFKLPRFFVLPTVGYPTDKQFRHRDILAREHVGFSDDRYLSATHGKVRKLIVQTSDDVYNAQSSATWRRTYIVNIAPIGLRLANWPTDHVRLGVGKLKGDDLWWTIAKWIPATLALTIFLFPSDSSKAKPVMTGLYDPFPYKYYGYAKAARNTFEDATTTLQGQNTIQSITERINPVSERALRPRYLCFLDNTDRVKRLLVEEWVASNPGKPLGYIVVAYTAEQFSHDDKADMDAIHALAKRAALDVGVRAYWIAASCMPDGAHVEQDVYRIGDVIRGAHSLIVAVGPTSTTTLATMERMLQQWGTRMWTYPEVLLSPGDSVTIYSRDGSAPQVLRKNQFAAAVWSDAKVSRQLLDHYAGNTVLSRLELVTLALQCLYARETLSYLPGDRSYALMGLLRLHPRIDKTDSAFEAFARLSLANDSDMLLERLICLLPRDDPEAYWQFADAWDAKLWDIYPTCQVAGLAHNDTVIIDGLRAANVRWKSFAKVANLTKPSFSRRLTQTCWHSSPLFFFLGLILMAVGAVSNSSSTYSYSSFERRSLSILMPRDVGSGGGNGVLAIGVIFFLYGLVIIGMSPWMLRKLYQGKFWWSQPWLFGFEGYLNIETLERQIFGANLERLQWSPHASPLSRHAPNKHGECVGVDPINDPDTAALVERGRYAQPGDMRVFTIVDTGSMQVSMFLARRPPVAFLLAGEEGGMQRAIGVSYEWETATCYRETVLRLETPTQEKMERVGRLRLGLHRKMPSLRPSGSGIKEV